MSKLDSAIRLHRTGQLRQAEAAYRQFLLRYPRDGDALHLLGLVCFQSGNPTSAVTLIAQAIECGGPVPAYCDNLGVVLRSLGRPGEAAACFRQAIGAGPGSPEAYRRLGASLFETGDYTGAAGAFERAIRLDPRGAASFLQLGNTFYQLGRVSDAEQAYRRAISLSPDLAEAHHNLGVALMNNGRLDEAANCFAMAVRHKPDYPTAHNNLGVVRHKLASAEAAEPHYRDALVCAPTYLEARYNLGRAQQDSGRLADAEATYRAVIHQDPHHTAAHNNLGNTLVALGRPEEAIGHYRGRPFNRSIAELLCGRFHDGWEGYEARERRPVCPGREWDGSPLDSRSILLHAEQGYGDTIQFVRYAQLIKQWDARVVLECHPALERLLRSAAGVDRVAAFGQRADEYDCYLPLLSLPRLFRTELDSIPGATPYLAAEPELIRTWAGRFSTPPSHRKVGIAWAGNPGHPNDRNRSIPPQDLKPLASVPQTSFISLQQEYPAGCEATGLPFAPLDRKLADFADTAALMMNLDLVISVDTAVAHLAGALARPVWTMLPYAPDWRWLLGRGDSPWYPTMRLFRQTGGGGWSEVAGRICRELEEAAVQRE